MACKLGCIEACKAREHGCASECPALPWQPLSSENIRRGGRYNWKGQPERLIYLRRFNGWHQFEKIGDHDRGRVWCEVRDEDLHMLEETPNAALTGASAHATGAK